MKKYFWLIIGAMAVVWLIFDILIFGVQGILPAMRSLFLSDLDEKGRLLLLLSVRLLMLIVPFLISLFAFHKYIKNQKATSQKK